jgi:lipopolysaccharide/colanic/teichoic acid biosynthesis glycosyltransferase
MSGDEHVFLSQNGAATKAAMGDSVPTMVGPTTPSLSVVENVTSLTFGSELLDESTFTRMLCLERKRTERSGRRFVLMLLESISLLKSADNNRTFKTFVDKLSQSIRETDVKGWYKNGSVFGVIFTEIGDGDENNITTVLLTKVTAALGSTMRIKDINQIRLSFHVYPEDITRSGGDGLPDLTLYPDQASGTDGKRASRVIKRAIDILGSVFALVILSPLLLAIALTIKLTSAGPVLFRQKRVGQYGTLFTFLKFRSMYLANDDTIHKEYVTRFISGEPASEAAGSEQSVFKLKNDPRVTRIGRLLRKSSFDEIPQLFNVLRGEMSLVGPRPPVPYEVACYEIWHKRRLLTVKPGITGLWQVGGRSRVKFNDMVRLDLQYAATWSVWLDIKILLRTPAAVLSGEGAY